MLGDSNTFLALAELGPAFRAGHLRPDIVGVPGYGLKDVDSYWLPALASLLPHHPRVVLVALGANDVDAEEDVAAFGPRLDRLMAAIGHRPVVWVTHYEGRDPPLDARARAINRVIRAAPRRWSNLTVLDLARVLARHPALLDVDRLHFSAGGRRLFAKDLVRAARRARGVSARG